MTVTVHFTEDDVRARPDGGGSTHFVLTPSAHLAARREGLYPRNSLETFTDWGHARCVGAGRRAIREFDATTKDRELPESVRLVGRQAAMHVAFIAQRLVRSLPAGPWCVRSADGEWQVADSPLETVEILVPRMLNRGNNELVSADFPFLPSCYRTLTRVVARWCIGKGPWAIRPDRKLKLGLDKALRESGFRTGNVRPTRSGVLEYVRLLVTTARGNVELPVAPLPTTDARVQACKHAFRDVTGALRDPCTRAGWQIYLPYLVNNIAAMLGIVEGTPGILRRLRSGITVSYEANSWLSAALFDAAKMADWPSVVANHNSHSLAKQAIADFVIGTHFYCRTSNPLVTDAAYWSPRARECTRPRRSDRKIRIQNYRAGYPLRAPTTSAQSFRVLHAGNYQNWSDFFPWIAETADEFVRGVARLACIISGIPGIDLTVRVRPKDEVNADVIQESIRSTRNVRIASTDVDFLEQLAESDLLIAHFSTTVEQALQMGIPVLLWGSVHRYQQFPGRMSPPTATDRSAVYAVADSARLAEMLAGIRDAHAGAPLTDEESVRYRFDSNVQDMAGLARTLFAEATRTREIAHA